jgi:hypothetical protein
VPFWLAALLGFLMTARATRFLNSDYLAQPFRDWVQLKTGEGKLYYLITCPWCASIYVAAPVATIAVLDFSPYAGRDAAWAIVGLWLGYSYLYGLVAQGLDGDE